jgi:single-strand DNA-binding protein
MRNLFVAGNLEAKPVLRKNEAGRAFTTLVLATNRFSYRKGQWDRAYCWQTVLVWGPDAETCEKHLEKGSPLAVEGQWDARKNLLIAETVHFLGLRAVSPSPQD